MNYIMTRCHLQKLLRRNKLSLVDLFTILTVLCLGYIAWYARDVVFRGRYYKDFFQDRQIIIAIILLIIFAVILYIVIGKETNAYGPEQF